MSYDVVLSPRFEREAKRLSKKYPSFKKDVKDVIAKLTVNPKLGIPLGHNCYKVRFPISSKNKGKSGGARLITYFVSKELKIFLLTVFDKSEMESVSEVELLDIIDTIED